MTVEGYKHFIDAESMSAFDVNAFLMSQAVTRFDTAADRDAALEQVVTEGMVSYNKDTGELQLYDGSAWQTVAVGSVGVTDHGALTGLGDDDHPQYLLKTGGTVTGQTTFSAIDGVKITGSSGGIWFDDRNNDGSKWVVYHSGAFLGLWNGSTTPFQFQDNGVGIATNWSVGTGSSTNAFVGGSNYWRPQDQSGNSYFDINNGQFYVDSDTYYFRNRASTNSLVIDSSGNGTFTGGVYASNWFRTYGESGLYSESYGQHFYPDAGGFFWDIDGPLRVRSGHEGGIQGYLGFHDANGFGLLHSGGAWWLNTNNNDAHLVIGGSQANNAFNTTTGRRLMFGGGDADAQGNYYIGTNMENYGGNYTKLDMFWHTGVRIAAMRQYGGIRMYGSITGSSLSDELFSVGKGNGDVRATNSMRAYAYYGHSNIAGTGNAIHTPNGIYSTGTNWLYGLLLTNGSDIGQSSQRVGQVWSNGWLRTINATGWYNDTYGGGVYMTDSNYVRIYNNKGLRAEKAASSNYDTATVFLNANPASLSFHPGGQAPQFRVGYNNNTIYCRNWPDTGWCVLEADVIDRSSCKDKQDIADFRNTPVSLSSDADATYERSGLDIAMALRPRHYRWDWHTHMRQLPTSKRRDKALQRLNRIRANKGLEPFESDELWHECGRDCDGTPDEPCWWVKDWQTGYFGFVAEEVGEVAPEATRFGEENDHTGVKTLAVTAIAIAAIQELTAKVGQLEAQIQGAT